MAHRWILWAAACCLPAWALAAPAELSNYPGNLEGTWRFQLDPNQTGEAEGWAAPAYDDTAWAEIKAPGRWEDTEAARGYDGVAWYRKTFVVPKAWAGKPLVLLLSSVDDEDRTFLNGALVGETGPGLEQAVLVRRRYAIPADAVRPGEVNVLAIRVRDYGGPGGMMGPSLYLLPEERAHTMLTTLPGMDAPLHQRFAAPPAAARILKIVHGLPDQPERQKALFDTLTMQGFGGIVTNVSFKDYLESEPLWGAFTTGVEDAHNRGMAMWLYDERGYPSCKAGGITLRDHPEWQAWGLYFADTESDGGTVSLALPPGTPFKAAAYPRSDVGIDLKGEVDLTAEVADGTLTWEAPAGAWWIMAITEGPLHKGTHADGNLSDPLPYPNLLMREPTDRFIEVTHGGYAKHLGNDLGKYFISTFTDEPSLMSLYLKKQPYLMVPWAPAFSATFLERRGYAIEPALAALIADAGPEGLRARHDFWLTVGELVSENYFGAIQEWCDGHNILSGGHLLLEESALMHVPLYGDFFRCIRRLTAPSIDCLTSIPEHVAWHIARLISSAAELEGRTDTMSETSDHVQRYRREGDTRPVRIVTEAEIRGACNRLILNGITTITSYYSFAGLSTEQLNRLNEWIGRCSTMLSGGRQVADVAVVYPVESLWVRFAPAHHQVSDSPWQAQQAASTYQNALNDLYAHRRDFTVIDARTLAEGVAQDGALTLRNLAWRTVILPSVDTLPLEAWQNLAAFWRAGGCVIALGARPAHSAEAFPSAEVQALGEEMFGKPGARGPVTNPAGGVGILLPEGEESLLTGVLDAVLEPDIHVDDAGAPLRVTHRRIDGHEVYFIINDRAEPWEGAIGLPATGTVEQWDPATGAMTTVTSANAIPLALPGYGGMFYRFEGYRLPARLSSEAAAIPHYQLTPLPNAEPALAGGQFVDKELLPGFSEGDAQSGWRAIGAVTKSDVDTFLFASFNFAQPVDLSDAAAIAVDLRMPPGQKPAAVMHLIIRDAHGIEYIARLGQGTHANGERQVLVRREQFSLASWSPSTGSFDFAAVTCIRAGWGGYLGKQGERIEFGFRAPQAARIAESARP